MNLIFKIQKIAEQDNLYFMHGTDNIPILSKKGFIWFLWSRSRKTPHDIQYILKKLG